MNAALLIANLLLAAASGAVPPHCQAETLPAARAACIGHSAEAVLHRIDLALAEISAGVQGAQAQTLARFQAELLRLQSGWRVEMEAHCAAGHAAEALRQRCRYRAALARQSAIDRALTQALARLPGMGALTGPSSVEVFIPLPRHRRTRPGALPYLCLDIPLGPDTAGPSWSRCGGDR